MRPRVRGRPAAALLGAAALLAAAAAAAWRQGTTATARPAGLPVRAAPTAMPAAVARPAWQPVAGDSLASVADFTLVGDTLVVLDARDHRVRLLRRDGGAWRTVGGWGRRGGGPGEFQRPAAVALVGAGAVAVADGTGRVQRFDLAGRLLGAERAAPPCTMFAPTLAYGGAGTRWLAGNCAGPGRARDTVFTVLFRADGDGDYRELARRPRMAMDLSWGTALATLHPLADDQDVVHFGTGLDDCALRLDKRGGPAETRCGLVRERLRAPEPPELAAQRRSAQRRGQAQLARLLRWPETLPPYFGIVRAPDALLLARPVSGDSLAVVPAGRPFDAAAARLVAPLRGFVSCARGACLWFDGERIALWRADGDIHLARSEP